MGVGVFPCGIILVPWILHFKEYKYFAHQCIYQSLQWQGPWILCTPVYFPVSSVTRSLNILHTSVFTSIFSDKEPEYFAHQCIYQYLWARARPRRLSAASSPRGAGRTGTLSAGTCTAPCCSRTSPPGSSNTPSRPHRGYPSNRAGYLSNRQQNIFLTLWSPIIPKLIVFLVTKSPVAGKGLN